MTAWSWRPGLSYGLLGLPLAFAALPLYVVLPQYYAREFGMPLGLVGALLMAARLLDGITDPWLGHVNDRLYRRGWRLVLWVLGAGAGVLALGMASLFHPLVQGLVPLALWLVVGLVFTSLAYSLLLIAHQAWGVRLGGDEAQRSRIVAWREGPGLVGVIAASVLSTAAGPATMLSVFALSLAAGWLALCRAPRPVPAPVVGCVPGAGSGPAPGLADAATDVGTGHRHPLRVPAFRRLLAVFLCNGTASAVPAALMLFFAQDRLLASPAQIALFLVLYFLCGALSMPAWVALVQRLGLPRSWLAGMLLAVACFVWTAGLASGQWLEFAVICALTGVALGADLALPGALLARLIEREGAQGRRDGAYLGWWNLATKLNLALAAGTALPLLQWGGYVPGSQDALALQRLAWAYALFPCALKLLSAGLLHVLLIRQAPFPTGTEGVNS